MSIPQVKFDEGFENVWFPEGLFPWAFVPYSIDLTPSSKFLSKKILLQNIYQINISFQLLGYTNATVVGLIEKDSIEWVQATF